MRRHRAYFTSQIARLPHLAAGSLHPGLNNGDTQRSLRIVNFAAMCLPCTSRNSHPPHAQPTRVVTTRTHRPRSSRRGVNQPRRENKPARNRDRQTLSIKLMKPVFGSVSATFRVDFRSPAPTFDPACIHFSPLDVRRYCPSAGTGELTSTPRIRDLTVRVDETYPRYLHSRTCVPIRTRPNSRHEAERAANGTCCGSVRRPQRKKV